MHLLTRPVYSAYCLDKFWATLNMLLCKDIRQEQASGFET